MNKVQRFATYAALGLSLAGCYNTKKEATSLQPTQSEVNTTEAFEGVERYRFLTKKGDSTWRLARMAYGSGAKYHMLINDNFDPDFNPNRDLMPDTWIDVTLTAERAEKFRKLYPDRTLKRPIPLLFGYRAI